MLLTISPQWSIASQIKDLMIEFNRYNERPHGLRYLNGFNSVADWLDYLHTGPGCYNKVTMLSVDLDTRVIVGGFTFTPVVDNYDFVKGGLNLSYCIRPTCRGQGLGTEQLRSAMALARSMGHQGIVLAVRDGNNASKRCIEKVGGYTVGRLFGCEVYNILLDDIV